MAAYTKYLLAAGGKKVGGVGLSGDTSCTDHMVAWRVRRRTLNLDHFGPSSAPVKGVAGSVYPDNIIFEITPNPSEGTGISAGGFGHPTCLNLPDLTTLPAVRYD